MELDFNLIMTMIFHVIGGLGIFLFGMKNMSEGMQAVAGQRLRRMIGAVTNNRIMATGVGTLVTAIIQSSSVTTVMVVGFVNSGIMTLSQSLGVIMGANIGTTITGWILVLKVGKWGLPLLGIAAFVYLFTKKERLRYWAMAIMGIGMIFFGLELMKAGFKPIRSIPAFMDMFSHFSADTYFGVLGCAFVGCMLTMIVQSSSATLGITMGLAATGIIHFETAAALVLGENIGTTITALLASIGTTTNARRAAYFHAIFNVLGVLWITALFFVYVPLVTKVIGVEDPDAVVMKEVIDKDTNKVKIDPETDESMMEPTYPYTGRSIAAVHTGFNVINVILFLPLAGYLAAFLIKVVPEKKHKETPHLTALDMRLLESPVIGIEQSRIELLRMSTNVQRMMTHLKTIITSEEQDEELIRKVFHKEEVLDIMQKEVITFLADFLAGQLPHSYTDEARQQLRIADEFESVGDYIANILKSYLRMTKAGHKLPEEDLNAIILLHETIAEYIDLVNKGLEERNPDVVSWVYSEGDAIKHTLKELRKRHIEKLSDVKTDPIVSSSFSDMLNSYRRVKDHTVNIAEAFAGEK